MFSIFKKKVEFVLFREKTNSYLRLVEFFPKKQLAQCDTTVLIDKYVSLHFNDWILISAKDNFMLSQNKKFRRGVIVISVICALYVLARFGVL
jgi:hypothetical protein